MEKRNLFDELVEGMQALRAEREGKMNERIREFAMQAGFYANPDVEKFEKFATLVAAAEREACALICEAFGKTLEVDIGDRFAEEIRARGDA